MTKTPLGVATGTSPVPGIQTTSRKVPLSRIGRDNILYPKNDARGEVCKMTKMPLGLSTNVTLAPGLRAKCLDSSIMCASHTSNFDVGRIGRLVSFGRRR